MLLHAILGLSPAALAALIGICILGGSAKGALGIGIPLLAVPLTAPFMDLPAAIALLTVPIFATNLGQAIEGTGTKAALLRLWPMLLAVVAGTVAGVHLLVSIDRTVLNGTVGALLVLVAGWLFCRPRIALGFGAERFAGPPIGLLAGVMGGVSGMFGPPLIAYMIGLGLRPNEFVKHISILFLAAGATLVAGARRRRRDVRRRCRGLDRGARPDLYRDADRALAAPALPAGPVPSARARRAGDRRPGDDPRRVLLGPGK